MMTGAIGLLMLLQPVAPATPPPAAPDIAAAVAAAALPPLDGTAFRFTDIAVGGRAATVFDARRTATATQRTVVSLSAGPAGWTVDDRETRRLAAETFDYMSGRIATAIAKGGPATPCPDGADYLSERADAGSVKTLHGCGADHPNLALARLFGVRETP